MSRGRALSKGGLAGRRVVVTRAPRQAAELVHLLMDQGAEAISYPCIDIKIHEDTRALDTALRAAAAGTFDWLVITSANVSWALARRAAALEIDLSGVRVAAIGPKTAQSVQELLRIDVELVPSEYRAEALAAALQLAPGQRLLLPQSDLARPVLARGLRDKGAAVTAIDAYQTVIGQGGRDVPAMLAAGGIDAIIFTSSSTVTNFLLRLEREGGDRAQLEGVCKAAIGPVTARTMRENDLAVDLMPPTYTLGALIESLKAYYPAPPQEGLADLLGQRS
jgi:uroporphyrinogen-III synthase